MKKLLHYISLALIVFSSASCSKYDNFDEPAETLYGQVSDASGNPIQTEAGDKGTRIKLEELSWSDSPTPYYFYSEQDGAFNNTKIFKGNYRISVEGPFVPLLQYDESGKVTTDNSVTTDILGKKEVNFTVEAFLKLSWIGEPVYNADDQTISVQVKLERGTENPDFQQNITDIFLFVNALPYIGNNNYDSRYSTKLEFSGDEANTQLGQAITLTSSTGDKIPGNRTYYLRIGARTDYGLKYYNYTDVKSIVIP